jgi:hypothetical protein
LAFRPVEPGREDLVGLRQPRLPPWGELVSVVSAFARRHGAYCFATKNYAQSQQVVNRMEISVVGYLENIL